MNTRILSEYFYESPRDDGDIVIVGNGIAGITAALEMRRLSPERHVTVITGQVHPTIYTPALKQFALGKLAREQLLAHPMGIERASGIYMMNAYVESIHAHDSYLSLSNGRAFGFASLLLATGSRATGLDATLPGLNFDGVLSLHTLHDYFELRRRVYEVKEVVVIGGGIHAIETVMSLHRRHIRVHWLIRSKTFLPHMLDEEASSVVLEDCRRAGIHIQTGVEVVGIAGRVGAVAGVVTGDDQFLPCQLVIPCTGSRPVTELATHCDIPLEQQNGYLVDAHFRTSVASIFAAGDCVTLENPVTGGYHPRMQWHSALAQGRTVAASMTGHVEAVTPMGVPWHTTYVGSLPMLSVGSPLDAPQGVTFLTHRDRRSYRRLAFYDNRLIGYLALGGHMPDGFAIKRLIDEGHSVRGIEKELLMGVFDDRRYFSQPRKPVQPIQRTQKLPALQLIPITKDLHNTQHTEPLLPVIERSVEETVDESDDADVQEECEEIAPAFSELIASKNKRAIYTHAREIATMQQDDYARFLEEVEDTFGDSFPIHAYMRFLERERRRHSGKAVTPVRQSTSSRNKQLTPSKWLIDDVLPEGLYLVSDTQKIGVSWLNVALSMAVSGSVPVLGKERKVQQGNVFYLSLEENEERLYERIKQVAGAGNQPGDDFEYVTRWSRFDDGGVSDMEEWLETHPRTRLIIIDSWKKIKPTVAEETGDTLQCAEYEALAGLKYLADMYAVSILLYPRSARTLAGKTDAEPYGIAGAASCADGLLTVKQGAEQSSVLLSTVWKLSGKEVRYRAEFNRDTWLPKEALSERRNVRASTLSERPQPLLSVVH